MAFPPKGRRRLLIHADLLLRVDDPKIVPSRADAIKALLDSTPVSDEQNLQILMHLRRLKPALANLQRGMVAPHGIQRNGYFGHVRHPNVVKVSIKK
jgi:hypothetical protein